MTNYSHQHSHQYHRLDATRRGINARFLNVLLVREYLLILCILNNIHFHVLYFASQGEAFLKELWSYIVVELLKAIETEHNNDVLGEELHSLGKCIELLGTGCLTQEQMNEVVKV